MSPLSTLLNEQKFSTRLMENMAEHLSKPPLPVAAPTGLTSLKGRNGATLVKGGVGA
jgi:hypothetical protein